ncbi:MAG: asparaginase domain-containing protein [bacterium]|nr:asparaginase [Gammaproteobacteria bacterium]HIL97397.1 asparaginase [Pseudomonadales bacterium]
MPENKSSQADSDADSVLVITTGGTIDKVYFDSQSDYEVGESVVGELLVQARVEYPFSVLPLMRKDSLEMDDDDRRKIFDKVSNARQKKIVITHGTDTMTETARVLATIADKTIVLTGSLAPARFAQTDATFNIGMAFAAVQSLAPGTYIVMNGQVFSALSVEKDRKINQFVAR